MSLVIETLDELKALVKRLGIKVTSVEELRDLLVAVNRAYNPEAARLRVLKFVGVTACSIALGCAGLTSFILMAEGGKRGPLDPGLVSAVLGIVWGVAGLLSLLTIFFITFALRPPRPVPFTVDPSAPPGLGGASSGPGSPGVTTTTAPDEPPSLVTRFRELS